MVAVTLDGRPVYGGAGLRVRVALNEWEQFGFLPDRQSGVEAPGHDRTFLLTSGGQTPPFAYLRFPPGIARRRLTRRPATDRVSQVPRDRFVAE